MNTILEWEQPYSKCVYSGPYRPDNEDEVRGMPGYGRINGMTGITRYDDAKGFSSRQVKDMHMQLSYGGRLMEGVRGPDSEFAREYARVFDQFMADNPNYWMMD